MGIAMITIAISSCTEDTMMVGNTLVNSSDQFTIASDTFDVSTRSFIADSVLARSSYSYLGKIKDPETGSYITADFMTQFSILEEEASNLFPPLSILRGEEDDHTDLALADSCFITILVNDFMGDSLSAMKMTVYELSKPVKENHQYYTNFDLEKNGFLRADGIQKKALYSLSDLTQNDSLRQLNQNGSNYFRIRIPLNEPYTDKQGITYNNYGSYLMRTYYDHPEYFKNSQTFIQKVCPGFYFKTTDGLGLMTEVYQIQLSVYIHYMLDGSVKSRFKSFIGNEEVLQTTHFTSDKNIIKRLAEDTQCTYLKAPDGIFTEVTLPVEDIKRGHENDTITSAKIVFRRMNDISKLSDNLLMEPQNLLILEKDSLYSFFENRDLPNNMASYLAVYNSNKNTYTFNNISGLINNMYNKRNVSANWNKAVIVPVQVVKANTSSTSTSVAGVSNELKVVSVRLVGGINNPYDPIRISIVYNQNE
jgi:hypothetical protein